MDGLTWEERNDLENKFATKLLRGAADMADCPPRDMAFALSYVLIGIEGYSTHYDQEVDRDFVGRLRQMMDERTKPEGVENAHEGL